MREPAVRCGAVPVFDLGRNVYNIAGDEQLRGLARFLIVASSCHADKNLPAAGFRVVDVPVVAAARFKGYIVNANLLRRKRCEIALPDKIFRKGIIGCAMGKTISF